MKTHNFKFELNAEVESIFTGFTGIIASRAEQLHTCNRYYVQPRIDKDGKIPDGWWHDEVELKQLNDPVHKADKFPGFKYPLNIRAQSNITELKGTIINRAEHQNGCINYYIQPKVDKDGKVPLADWVKEGDIILLEKITAEVPKKDRGGSISRNC